MNGFAFVLIVVYLYSAATWNDKLVQEKHKCPLTRLWCGQYNIEINAKPINRLLFHLIIFRLPNS